MSEEPTLYVPITFDTDRFQAAIKQISDSSGMSFRDAGEAFQKVADVARRAVLVTRRRRYYTTIDGRIHRNPHMRPLLHKGGKP